MSTTTRRFVCERFPVDDLPRDLYPQLPSGRMVRVIIEDKITDQELLAEFEREIEKGFAQLDAGEGVSAEQVAANLRARFGQAADAAE